MYDVFVGRAEEVSKLDAVLADAMAGAGRNVLVSGEPGIGKTRLAEEISRRGRAKGCVVAWGRSWESEATPSFWPWLEILRALERDDELATIVRAAREQSPELDTMFSHRASTAGDGDARDRKDARFRLYDAVARLLRTASERRPLVLVLDDLHAADAATRELLAFFTRTVRGARILTVVTSRDGSFAAAPEVSELLGKIARECSAFPLGRLARSEVAHWVSIAAPKMAARADRIFDGSEGNPLFVQELMAAWSTTETGALPHGIREAIRAHLDLLSEPARSLLEIASVFGREPSLSLVRDLADEVDSTLFARLEEVVATTIVSRAGDDRLRFSHVLLREELYARIPQPRRVEWHRGVARRLLRDGSHSALAAHHALLGDDVEQSTNAVIAAMTDASGRLAFGDAVSLGRRAIGSLAGRLSERFEARLRLALGEASILAGARDEGRATCARAFELAEASGDAELIARAALAHAVEIGLGRDDESARMLRRALSALGEADSSLRARLLSRLGLALIPAKSDEGDEPLRHAREAVDMARRVGDEDAVFATLRMFTTVFPEAMDVEERFARNAESIALALRLRKMALVLPLLGWQIGCWLELGRLDGAKSELDHVEKILAPLPPVQREWRTTLLRSFVAALEGRFDFAFETAQDLLRASIEAEHMEGATFAAIQLMSLPYLGGDAARYEEVEPLVCRVLSRPSGGEIFLSVGDATLGRTERVRASMSIASKLDLSALPGAASLGFVVARAGLVEHAERFYELAKKCAARTPLVFGPGAMSSLGPVDLAAGRLAMMLGRNEEALFHLERCLAFVTRLPSPPLVAQTERALAEVHAAIDRDEHSAPSAARPSLERSFTLERHGDLWRLRGGGPEVLVKDARGFAYLEALVQAPHRDIHVLELVGIDDGDAGPVLDERAKREYRARAQELREELDEATDHGDRGRIERAQRELDALAGELTRALGLGGRDRRAASHAERARINVQRRLKDAIRRVVEQDTTLGRHLELSVKTGAFCRYAPTWPS